MPPASPLTVRDDGPVRVLTLSRPAAGNALDAELVRALGAAVSDAVHAAEVRAIVLAGDGADFCRGFDVAALAAASAAGRLEEFFERLSPVLQQAVLRLAEGPKPTIAAVAGVASGAGFDLALACDLRVVADDVAFSTGYATLGLVPVGGAPHHLVRLLGAARARALLLLPDRAVTADEAVRLGLAVETAPRAAVLARALALAHRVAAGPATALRLVKRLLAEDATRSLGDALEDETTSQRVALADPDAAAGLASAVAGRPPSFPSAGTPPRGPVSK
ncbi:MAG: enoyl-CoA hydratase/isomerase family protein [Planctomycetota bacterium]